jgi:hypothetical protein
MPKDTVLAWDTAPGNNTDISGINIAEGCPAGGINDAIRAMMAQLASWVTSASGPLLKSGGAVSGPITGLGNGSTVLDGNGITRGVGYRSLPLVAKSTAYTLALSDVGQGVVTSAALTVPATSTTSFMIGDTIALYNNSAAAVSISPASNVTLRLAGSTTTGVRSISSRGLATLIKVGSDEWVISGMGVS